MFRGANLVTIDAKGRLAVPVKYRQKLSADMVVVTIDIESKCLLLYPLTEWLLVEAKIDELPSFNPITRKIKRLLIGHAVELELDGQGRILLSKNLRDYAGLNKKSMLIGQGKKLEIWCQDIWQSNCNAWQDEGVLQDKELPVELQELVL